MIFYFSATGNSKYVAARIAEEFNVAESPPPGGRRNSIISITDCMKSHTHTFDIKEDETIGIVAPTYFLGLPTIVCDFLSHLTLNLHGEHYIYYVSTYGTTSGQSGAMANKILNKKEYSVDAFFGVVMPDTWTPMFDLSDKDNVIKINQKAEPEINQIIDKIKTRSKGDYVKSKVPAFFVNMYYKTYGSQRKTKRLTLEDDTCIGCGVCAKQCPVDAIEIRDKRPVWVKDKCVLCLGCLHKCPEFAIQYGKNTKKHGQYVHPEINV